MSTTKIAAPKKLTHIVFACLGDLCRRGVSSPESKAEKPAYAHLVSIGAAKQRLSGEYVATEKAAGILAADIALPGKRTSR